MSGNQNELLIKITGDATKYQDALDEAKKKTDDLNSQFETMAKVGAISFAALTGEAYLSIEAFAKQEQAVNSLTQTMQQQGIYSKSLLEDYQAQAESLEKLTGVDNEAILNGQALLQSMIGQQKISKELTAAVVDLAAKKKIDLYEAFGLVGKAATNGTEILKRYGLEIADTGTRAGNLAAITKGLTQEFGGAAEASTQGVGSVKLLAVAYEDLQKAIGSRLAPAFEGLVGLITKFLNAINDNEELKDLIVSAGVAAAGIALLATGIGTAGAAFLGLRATLAAFNIATEASTIAVRGLVGATGLGLLILIASEIYLNWNSIWPRVYAVFKTAVDGIANLASGLGEILTGAFTMNPSKIKEGFDKVKAAVSASFAEYNQVVAQKLAERGEIEDKHEADQTAKNNAAGAAREAEVRRRESLLVQVQTERFKIVIDKLQEHNADYIKLEEEESQILEQLADDKNKKIWGALDKQLQTVRDKKLIAYQNELQQQREFDSEILTSSQEFKELSLTDQKELLQKSGSNLRQSLLTEKTARQQNANEQLQIQIKGNNEFLKNQAKFGTEYALINREMHTEIYEGSKSAFSDLAVLENSSNATLKSIGKAAAAANIAIKTAESAMNVFAGFSTIPIVGYGLGIAAAAAVFAYGAEQESKVFAAADGGLLTGGIPGKDSIPVLGMPGELVVPTKNFDEVVGAVAAQRAQNGGAPGPDGSSSGSFAWIELSLKDNLVEFVETKIMERQKLGTSQLRLA